MKQIIPWIITIAAIVVIISLLRGCGPTPAPVIKYDTSWVKIHDTIINTRLVPYQVLVQGKPVTIDKHDTIFLPDTAITHLTFKDTSDLLTDYFKVRKYHDTARMQYGYVAVNSVVAQNRLKMQSYYFNMNVPTVTKQEEIQKRLGFLGLDVGVGNGIAMGGLQFTYIDRKQNMFHFRTDYSTLGSFIFAGGVDWKISLFK